jgi:predicted N-acetyltransferase YhbS
MALDVGRITESETADAIGVLARGMRDNPIHVAALGDDPAHRVDAPHFHLGPVAADAGKQGRGIGTALLEVFCTRVDQDAAVTYLETDKAEYVGFYARFGFETVAEADVIGVPNWFMRRSLR